MTAVVPDSEVRTRLMHKLQGHWTTSAIATAAELRLADRLAGTPRPLAEIAAHDLRPEPLGRLLGLLAGLGLVVESAAGWALTPEGELLRTDHPESLRDLAVLYEQDFFAQAWRRLPDGVRTGASPFALAHGEPVFDFLAHRPEVAATYAAGIAAGNASRSLPPGLVDLDGAWVVDVGGGDGSLLAALLAAAPTARGTLLERPAALPHAARVLAGLPAELVEGDFFSDVPAGADVYLLSRVLHNWSDADSVRILGVLATAMRPGARLLVCERVLPDDDHPPLSHAFDLQMLVMTGGRERTRSEYDALLARAGLRGVGLHTLPLEMHVLEVTR